MKLLLEVTNDSGDSKGTKEYAVVVLMVSVIGGLVTLGIMLGDWIADKLKLYTDMDLENAERNVAEIKRELGKN